MRAVARAQSKTEIGGMFCAFQPHLTHEGRGDCRRSRWVDPTGTARDVDAGIVPDLLHFAGVHLGKRKLSVRALDIATDLRASAQLLRSRAGGALGDSLILRELTHFERVDCRARSPW